MNCGSCGGTCAAAVEGCIAGTCQPLQCAVIYVSPGGTDNPGGGCDPGSPVLSVGFALSRAKEYVADGIVRTIRVASGNYTVGNLMIDFDVVLEGGYDVASWGRGPLYGYPTFASPSWLKSPPGPAGGTFAMRLSGGTSAMRVDGFTIQSMATMGTPMRQSAVFVDGASATLSNNHIIGGASMNGAEWGSAGLYIDHGRPDVTANLIEGGSGTVGGDGYGSIGLVSWSSDAPHIHGNTIVGGTGSSGSGIGSVGLVIAGDSSGSYTAPAARAVENNTIQGGTGTGPSAVVGVYVTGNLSIDLLGNHIENGTGTGVAGTGVVRGVFFEDVIGSVRILRNAIYAGDTTTAGGHRGIDLVNAGTSGLLWNNLIHTGNVNQSSSTDGSSFAIRLDQCSSTKVLHNTMLIAPTRAAIDVAGNNIGVFIENNVLLGMGAASSGIQSEFCLSNGAIGSLRNNLFVEMEGALLRYDPAAVPTCNGAPETFSDMDVVVSELTKYAVPADGNLTVGTTPTCVPGSTCVQMNGCGVGTPTQCLQTLLVGFSTPDVGKASMFGGGWALSASTDCRILSSSLNDAGSVQLDFTGATRTSPPSMGAYEINTCP
jgi:hypothetical protein